MDNALFLDICRSQYGGLFAMIDKAVRACPESLWDAQGDGAPFWQQAYHTLQSVDFYFSETPKSFRPPAWAEPKMGNLKETPAASPTRRRILAYLRETRNRGKALLDSLASAPLDAANPFEWTGPTIAHRLVYNLRHAQHHVGVMNFMLARHGDRPADWVCRK